MTNNDKKIIESTEWITADELAQRWSVTARTVHNWRKRGIISKFALSLPGQGWRFDAQAIENFFRSRHEADLNKPSEKDEN
jgi:hypothetical protein